MEGYTHQERVVKNGTRTLYLQVIYYGMVLRRPQMGQKLQHVYAMLLQEGYTEVQLRQ